MLCCFMIPGIPIREEKECSGIAVHLMLFAKICSCPTDMSRACAVSALNSEVGS